MSSSYGSSAFMSLDSEHLNHGSSYESLSIDDGFADSSGNSDSWEETEKTRNHEKHGTQRSLIMPASINEMTATERLQVIQEILHLFFNNRISEAEAAVEPFKDSCQHFSHAKVQFVTISSLLTLDPDMMEKAKGEISRHIDLLQTLRPKRGALARFFGREDCNKYTDEELIAELNYGEALIDYALFTFLNGQSIMTLIRAAFKLNTSHNVLKFCHEAYMIKSNWKEDRCRVTFEAGVLNGIGMMNLILSNLPSSILRLLSIAGMSSDRDLGIDYLKRVSRMEDQPRIQWNYCMILGYTIYLEQMLGFGEGANAWADEVAAKFLSMYPNGAVPLFLNARVALLRSEPRRAVTLYQRCLAIHNDWKQIDLFCYFDLVWSYAVIMDWENASKYCGILMQNCTWGHAINMHLYASLKYMHNEKVNDARIGEEIRDAMSRVEGLRKRYAGRSYPAEKFAVERAKKFFIQDHRMLLPMFELFYVWNVFAMMRRDPQLLRPIINMINDKLQVVDKEGDLEDKCVLLFLRGVCAKYLSDFQQAVASLNQALELGSHASLQRSYVVPHSLMELGLVHKDMGDLKQSRSFIEQAKSNRSPKYLLEALVHLKAHSVLRQIDELESKTN